ncbi:hypothetical protein HOP52_07475 [Halomonas campisalis]|uniref:Rubrerythrin diiron-binding domain-containing protein n=1 Tax=Billgrantia campisalis TaxID=74661 RepID=A0ABS9P739_9GAMM|nr:hypothetical protein [Halomonas campisalis]MCG6657602.1 hypothetical protein [Halomonas campisalis]MDR5862625.1 hypothetical protein [Halomonas campisalis]
MPRTQTTTARLVLVLDELLTLADAHERAELTRYRRLAFNFLTFNTATSRLMASLGIQCEIRVEELQRIARQLGIDPSPTGGTKQRQGHNGRSTHRFFIDGPDAALDELQQAIAGAEYSLHFYEHLRDASAIPDLFPALSAMIRQKRAEHAVLEEYLASFREAGRAASAG